MLRLLHLRSHPSLLGLITPSYFYDAPNLFYFFLECYLRISVSLYRAPPDSINHRIRRFYRVKGCSKVQTLFRVGTQQSASLPSTPKSYCTFHAHSAPSDASLFFVPFSGSLHSPCSLALSNPGGRGSPSPPPPHVPSSRLEVNRQLS